MSTRAMTERWLRRYRVLDAARGLGERPPRAFRLRAEHFARVGDSPSDFHQDLCRRIRGARSRVLLASLYVGPAVSSAHAKEAELLSALSEVPKHLHTRVLLDHNRALRPVPRDGEGTTSSAEAVAEALNGQQRGQEQAGAEEAGEEVTPGASTASMAANQKLGETDNGLYLYQVLSSPWKYILPNPANEIAGVFHIKVYIVDDALILSGANLSEEYFTDRNDRYMCLVRGGGGMVDWYAQLVELLCEHAEKFGDQTHKPIAHDDFQRRLADHLTENPGDVATAKELFSDEETVAVCLPTFQPRDAPKRYRTDTQITDAVMDACAAQSSVVRLSSAYLNPTSSMLRRLKKFLRQELVSAGHISHGFKPKKKAGNKGKAWIPAVFDRLAMHSMRQLPNATLYHWQREGWTFHSKGMWLANDDDLVAAVLGSGNYGERSAHRDLESNCVMILAPRTNNPFQSYLNSEWESTLSSAVPVDDGVLQRSASLVPMPIRMLLPFLKRFF